MSHYDYEASREIELAALTHNWSFKAQLMALMRRADSDNLAALRAGFPDVHMELYARYNAPGGLLPSEQADQPDEINRDEPCPT